MVSSYQLFRRITKTSSDNIHVLNEVFVISRIIKVEVLSVSSRAEDEFNCIYIPRA